SGMRRAAFTRQIDVECPFLCKGHKILCWLADDDEFRIPLQRIRRTSPGSVDLLADYEEKAETVNSGVEQSTSSVEHRRDDAFCVARAASVEVLFVFSNRQYGRHRVDVGTKNNLGIIIRERHDIESLAVHGLTLHTITQTGQVSGQVLPNLHLVST